MKGRAFLPPALVGSTYVLPWHAYLLGCVLTAPACSLWSRSKRGVSALHWLVPARYTTSRVVLYG